MPHDWHDPLPGRSRLLLSLETGRRLGYQVGIKLVRGAYIVSETALAQSEGYKNPVHDGIQRTHDNYNQCASHLIDCVPDVQVGVCCDWYFAWCIGFTEHMLARSY